MSQISYSGTILKVNGNPVMLPHEILEAFDVQGVIIVFLDPDAELGSGGQYRNLIGYSSNGTKLWEAELPTTKKSDVYWKIAKRVPLTVYSFSSYECELDISTGKILRKDFYK
ncbi:hypothetical protein [Bowmanella dokdonensis]|uniref:Uncharacterized protein n=1 Tax=Bowmanella dokdonensis TaxID=751969 RepID=A0A939DS62_9ALTE|nr:hypothetical protein [Bowmanella dokdonensis]MBN7827367.1 hypothetical protein [Bowmanella dokdonensis]